MNRYHEFNEDPENKKKTTFMNALRNLAGNAGYRARQTQSAKKSNIRKSGGQRGS